MKSSASALLILLLLATPLLAFDEVIRVEPARPTSTDRLRVTVSGTAPSACVPRFDRVEGNVNIRFIEPNEACPAVMTRWSHSVAIGPLRPGTALVRVMVDNRTVATAEVVVTESQSPFEIVPSSGRLEGGAPVRIRPAYLDCSQICTEYAVLFDGVPAAVVGGTGYEAEVIPPPHAAGRVNVTIHTMSGGTITREDAFLYYDHAEGPPAEAFERILVPLMFEGEGALGSRWTSELTVRNRGDAGIDPWNSLIRCSPGERCRPQIPAGATLRFTPSTLLSWMHGYLFAVPREQADDLDFSLHIRDLSRQAESFGTEIPVVREADLPRSPIVLLDVPVNLSFRKMLRIYDLSAVDGTPVVMRWRLDDGTQYGGESHLVLRTAGRCVAAPCWLPEPSGIAIGLFNLPMPPNLTQGHLHVEIEPLMPYSRLWAFVTVTNNETQQVTTITPQ